MLELISTFQKYSHDNPIIAGAFSLYGLGIVTFLFRHLPEKIWDFIVLHCTTSLEFNNSDNGFSELNYASFMAWFEKNKHSKWSRTFALDSADRQRNATMSDILIDKSNAKIQCSIGNGFHFFWYKRKFFWMYRNKIDKPGIARLLYSIQIHYFGRNKKILHELINEFIYIKDTNKTGTYAFDEWDWEESRQIEPRKLSTVIIDKQIKNNVIHCITEFTKSKEWYLQRGIPYKLCILLHGIPGTGKTSLIKALADHFERNLCIMNINTMTDRLFNRAVMNVPSNSFLVIEDIDSAKATHERDNNDTSTQVLSLTGVLNSIDGLLSLNNTIIFITTNHLNKLDVALTRKGRIDHIFELKELTDDSIKTYIRLMFPDKSEPIETFKPIAGCDLQDLYLLNKNDYQAFINSIPK